jgi:hypothetical protein
MKERNFPALRIDLRGKRDKFIDSLELVIQTIPSRHQDFGPLMADP